MNRQDMIVYIVDDDDAVRDSLRLLLKSSGFNVQVYGGAQLFLESDIEKAGCLLLDLHMPDMSGLELLRLLRTKGWHKPVIVIGGRRDAGLDKQVLEAGAMAILSKPFDEESLFDLVRKALATENN